MGRWAVVDPRGSVVSLRASLIAAAVAAFVILGVYACREHKRAAHEAARADAAVLQEKVTADTSAASDKTARDVRVIIEKGQKEIEYVETLPGADTPIEPVRRAGLCGSLGRVFDRPVCADDPPDGKPASAVPDASR